MKKQTLSIDCIIVGIKGEARKNEFYKLNEETPIYLVVEENDNVSVSTIFGICSFGILSNPDIKKILKAHNKYAHNMWDLNYLAEVEYKAFILSIDYTNMRPLRTNRIL